MHQQNQENFILDKEKKLQLELKKYLSAKEVDKVCNVNDQLKNVNKIFKRVFKNKK